MRHQALGKHRWSVVPGLLLCITAAGPIYAAPERTSTQIAIGNPLPNSLVAGRISLSVAYNRGMGQITALTVFVDDKIQFSRNVLSSDLRGIQYLDLDTRTLADGNHTVKVVAMGLRGPLAIDEVGLVVRNGVNGGVDLVPPLVQLKGLQDGDTVSGKIALDVLAEDNSGMDLLVSVFVNRFPRLLKSSPPYTLELNTSEFLDPATGKGSFTVEAWAYDKASNLGKSRKLTLNVEPARAENQTIKKEDPTAPMGVAPLPAIGDAKIPEPMVVESQGEIVLPLRVPKSIPGATQTDASTRPLASQPGTKPNQATALTPKGSVKGPQTAEASLDGQGSLSGAKTKTPENSRPVGQPLAASGNVTAPPTLKTNGGPAATGAPRVTAPASTKPVTAPVAKATPAPAVKPQAPAPVAAAPKVSPPKAKPLQMASAGHRDPEIVPAPPVRTEPTTQVASAKIPMQAPDMLDHPGDLLEMGAQTAVPVPSPGGSRISTPGARAAKAVTPAPAAKTVKPTAKAPVAVAKATPPAHGMTIVVVDKKRTDRKGQPKVEIYRVSDRPVDRSYTVRGGESLHSIARKFNVTVKAIQVANAMGMDHGLRAGSIIKVPGTFDVVMNDKRVAFDVTPRIENGLPITPFRQIMEYAGGVVVWYPESQEIRAANEKTEIKLKIGSKEAFVNQTVLVMEREAFLDSGRTMVPISFMERALDLKAEYDVKSGTIMLVKR